MEIGIGAAEGGLFDAQFVTSIANAHRPGIFEMHVLIFERHAGKIGLHGDGVRASEYAADLKTAVHAAVSGDGLKMRCGLNESV